MNSTEFCKTSNSLVVQTPNEVLKIKCDYCGCVLSKENLYVSTILEVLITLMVLVITMQQSKGEFTLKEWEIFNGMKCKDCLSKFIAKNAHHVESQIHIPKTHPTNGNETFQQVPT